MTDARKKSSQELLAELHRVRTLLEARQNEDIPLLDDVVLPPARPKTSAAEPSSMPTTRADGAITRTEPAPQTQGELPGLHLPAPSEQELEALIDRLIDREMPRIRLELKRVLRDELRMRGLLK